MKRVLSIVLLCLASLIMGSACGWDRVEPGYVGILVDSGIGSTTPITATKWEFYGNYQTLVKWPIGQQVYVMDRSGSTGQIEGDDSVECLTSDTQTIAVDTQTDWRIDPTKIVSTYGSWKDTPLVGPSNRKSPGNYLEDLIIRNETRSAVRETCSTFTWADLLGSRQLEYQTKVDAEVKKSSVGRGVIIDQVTIRQRYPSAKLQGLMDARLEGQKQQEAQLFTSGQSQRQQEIDQAAAKAAGEKARIDAEAKAKVDLANASAASEQAKVKAAADVAQATANAEIARVKAAQETDAARAKYQVETDALKAQAAVVTPALVDLEKAKRWNGQGPTTIIGGDPQIINQIPR